MVAARYLIFGDLHGRILPAFRLAMAWEREHGVRLDGLLQVGDLGYFPDPTRLDKATARHAAADPLELGGLPRRRPQPGGRRRLPRRGRTAPGPLVHGRQPRGLRRPGRAGAGWRPAARSFAVDAYGLVRCIRDGRVETLPGPLRVGALWGIDDQAPNARRRTPERGRIREASLTALAGSPFDVLLSHDGPRDAVLVG